MANNIIFQNNPEQLKTSMYVFNTTTNSYAPLKTTNTGLVVSGQVTVGTIQAIGTINTVSAVTAVTDVTTVDKVTNLGTLATVDKVTNLGTLAAVTKVNTIGTGGFADENSKLMYDCKK